VVQIKDAVGKRFRFQIPISTAGFHHSGSHHSDLLPSPSIRVPPKYGNPHASVSGIVAACLDIQVRVDHSCVSAIK
jgi:hypothetical protein